jgi:hypothetical protein
LTRNNKTMKDKFDNLNSDDWKPCD